jgi:hypothetical protein
MYKVREQRIQKTSMSNSRAWSYEHAWLAVDVLSGLFAASHNELITKFGCEKWALR